MKKILSLFTFAVLLATGLQAQDSNCPENYSWTDTTIDGTNQKVTLPFGSYSSSSYYQYTCWFLYTHQELAALGITPGSQIKEIGFRLAAANGYSAADVTIYLKEVPIGALTTTADSVPLNEMHLVYSSALASFAQDWTYIELDSAFTFTGEGNLMIAVNRNSNALTSGTRNFYCSNSTTNKSVMRHKSQTGTSWSSIMINYRPAIGFRVCTSPVMCLTPAISSCTADGNEVQAVLTGGGTTREVAIVPSGQSLANVVQRVTTTADTVVLDSLDSWVVYDVYTRSVCDGFFSLWSVPAAVKTHCGVRQVTYNVNVTPANTDSCWVFHNAVKYSNYVTSNDTLPVYAVLPEFDMPLNRLHMNFRMSFGDDAKMAIGVMTDAYDTNSFVVYDSMTIANSSANNAYDIDFDRWTGPEGRVALRWKKGRLLQMRVDTVFGCYIPTDITFSGITDSSVRIDWHSYSSSTTGFEVCFADRSGNEYFTVSTDTNTLTVDSLQPGTAYWVKVRTQCSDGDGGSSWSTWPARQAFCTHCSGDIEIPYSITSSQLGNTVPPPQFYEIPCWTFLHDTATGVCHWVLPAIDTASQRMDHLKVQLDLRCKGLIRVGVMDSPTDTASFTEIGQLNMGSSTWTANSGIRTFYCNRRQGKHIALRFYQNYVDYINSVSIEVEPAAPVRDLAVSALSDTSATLAWTEQGVSTQWLVTCTSQDSSWNQTFVSTSTTFTIGGLQPYTPYTATVSALNEGDTSEARQVAFRTYMIANQVNTQVQAGTETSSGSSSCPVYRNTLFSWQQTIYPLSQYNTAGWIDTLWFKTRGLYNYTMDTSLTIYMGHADTTVARTVNDWVPMDELTQVYHADQWKPTQIYAWVPIVLDTPFFYNGYDELAVVFSHKSGSLPEYNDYYEINGAPFGTMIARYGNADESYADHPNTASGTRFSQMAIARFSLLTSTCTAVDSLVAEYGGGDTALVSWHESGSASLWHLAWEERVANSSQWQPVGDTIVDSTTAILSLSAGHTYRFLVRPVCSAGDTGYYNAATLTLSYPPAPLVVDTFEVSAPATTTNNKYPIDAYFADYGFEEEFIYTARQLAPIEGAVIRGLQFDYVKPSVSFDESFTMHMEEVADSTCTTAGWRHSDSAQLVWTGTVSVADSHWTVIFDSAFVYNGGHLAINTASSGLTGGFCTNSDGFRCIATSYPAALSERAGSNHVPSGNKSTNNVQPVVRFLYNADSTFCRRPMTLAVDSVWGHGALATWDSVVGAYGYEYQLDEGNWIFTATPSAVIDGLPPTSSHSVVVRTVCDSATHQVSQPTAPVTFTTTCGSIRHIDLPWSENFNDLVNNQRPARLRECWTQHAYTSYNYSTYYYADNYLNMRPENDAEGVYVVMPQFERPADLRISLSYYGNPNTTFAIGVMSNPDDTATFTPLHISTPPSSATSNGMRLFSSFDLNGCTDTLAYIAFRVTSTAVGFPTYSSGCALIDDITVNLIPTCSPVDSLLVDSIEAHQAILTIVDTASAGASYRVAYADTSFVTTLTTLPLTGLDLTTNYSVSVTKICADGSELTPLYVSFRTACGAHTLPWSFGFEGLPGDYEATTGSRFDAECWTVLNRRTANEPFLCNNYTTAHPLPHTGARALVAYCSGTPATVVVLPELEGEPQQWLLGLWCYRATTLVGNYVPSGLEIGLVTDPDDATTFIAVDTFYSADINAWRHFETSFPGFTEGRVAIRYMPGQQAPIYIDDITIDALPSCVPPTNLSVSAVTYSTALVNVAALIDSNHYRLSINNDSMDFYGSSYMLTGLLPDSDYTVSVRTVCADSSLTDAAICTFHTLCQPTALPWSENFDSMPVTSSYEPANLQCWGHLGTGILQVTDSHSLMFYNLSTQRPNIAILPNFEQEIANLELSLVMKSDVHLPQSSQNNEAFDIGYITDPADSTTFVSLATFSPSFCGGTGIATFTPASVTFGGAPAGARIALRHNEDRYSWNNWWYVDNLEVHVVEDGCMAPSQVSVSNISGTSATVNIATPGNPDHYWLYLSAVDSVEVVGNSYILTGLDEATSYTVSARTICDSGMLSDATFATFTTPCAIISTLPWSEDFNGVTANTSTYYGAVSLTSAFPCWAFAGGGYGTILQDYGSTNNRLRLEIASYERRCVAATPVVADGLGRLEVTFTAIPRTDYGYLEVGYTTSAIDTNYFVPVATFDCDDYRIGGNPMEHTYAVVFDSLPSGARIAFSLGMGGSSNEWHIDDIDVHAAQICPRPLDISVPQVGVDTALLVISDTADGQTYRIVLTSEADTAPVVLQSDSTTVTLTSLSAGTAYTVSVCALCSDGSLTSAVIGSFHTMCTPLTRAELPYEVDFESYPAVDTTTIDPCWRIYKSYPEGLAYGSTVARIVENNSYLVAAQSGTHAIKLGGGTQYPVYWTLPAVSDSLSDIRLSFSYREYWTTEHYGTYEYTIYIGVMTDPLDASTFTVVDSVSDVDSIYKSHTVDFSAYSGDGLYIALSNCSSSSIVIDDLTIECYVVYPPTNLQLLAVDSLSATVTWDNGGNEQRWVADLTAADAPESQQTINVSSKPLVLTSLTPATTYELRIAAIDTNNKPSVWSEPLFFTTLDTTPDVGISDIQNQKFGIQIYPNPASSTVTVASDANTVLTLLDACGRVMGRWNVETGKTTIDISNFPRGIYFMRFEGLESVTKLAIQ